jgi:Zn-dependent protease
MFESVSAATLLVIFISIIISMTLHEAMHAFTGLWLGDDTAQREGRITLNPLKHIDPFLTVLLPMLLIIAGLPPFFVARPVPFNPNRVRYDEFGAALVGVVGPLTNLLLAFAAAGILNLFGGSLSSFGLEVFAIFIFINIAFFVFNMVPFPPLDGSRVLYAFAPGFLQKLMYRIESLGLMAIFIFMFVFYPVLAPIVREITAGLFTFLV